MIPPPAAKWLPTDRAWRYKSISRYVMNPTQRSALRCARPPRLRLLIIPRHPPREPESSRRIHATHAPAKEDNMYRLFLIGTAAVAILTTASAMLNRAAATPLNGLADIPLASEQINPIEKTALCFYLDGWNGPGLYQCGYRHRHGEGFIRREREERRERFEDRRERGERAEDRRERRE